MFGFGKADKAEAAFREAFTQASGRLPDAIAALPPRERAAVLLLANWLLDLSARLHGAKLVQEPLALDAEASRAAAAQLFESREKLAGICASSAPRGMEVCHLRATELAAVTAGAAAFPGLAPDARRAWAAAWSARAALPDAVVKLRTYELEAGVEAVPRLADGKRASDVELLKVGGRGPALLRRPKAG